MKIKSLRLDNFQGISHAKFDFDGLSGSIYGDNATGKTTVFNAVTWLLFDKASTGAKNFTPKTKGATGDLHNLDHSAEASFIMPSGEIATFKKVYHEVWKKKRGSSTEEFDGHTVDFFIDGVPVKEKQYTGTLQNYCGGIERMKMLTMPDYFAEVMPWDARRKILLELCGDVTDVDVIRSSEDLRELDTYLRKPGTGNQFYSVDEYKKIATARKSEINKQLQSLPGRIDEAKRAMPDGVVSIERVKSSITQNTTMRESLLSQRAAMLTGGDAGAAIAEARKKTAEAEAALANAKSAYATQTSEANAQTLDEINKLTVQLGEVKTKASTQRTAARQFRDDAKRMSDQREQLRAEYAKVAETRWDEAQETCPTCGQELPKERIKAMKDDFNQRKSDRLIEIEQKGQKTCHLNTINSITQKAEEAEKAAALADTETTLIQRRIDGYRAKLAQVPAFETTEEYFKLSGEITICRAAEREAMQNGSTPDTSAIDGQIRVLDAELEDLQRKKAQYEQVTMQRQRIAELEDDEKRLGAEYEDLEHGVWLCDEFTKAKVRMLTSRIDGKFSNVRFRLFQEQLNGGVKDDCEVLVPSDKGALVPYRDANNAGRINAGLEIVDVLSEHWDMEMPVFIDNSEGVQDIVNTCAQVIQLVVPTSWDKIGEIARDAMIREYGTEENARTTYEAPGKKLHMEISRI